MIINVTLLIQACNFLIGYFIFKYLLFKPALAVILQEDARRDALIAQVEQHRLALINKKEEVEEQWKQAREKFKEQMPALPEPIALEIIPQPEQAQWSAQETQAMIQTVQKAIVSKAIHD